MKINFLRKAAALFSATALCIMCSCTGSRDADAGVIMREAKSNAEKMASCSAAYKLSLSFTADGEKYAYSSGGDTSYTAEPFTLKNVLTYSDCGSRSQDESYTAADGEKLWYYFKSGGTWQKTDASGLDKSPLEQIDALRILKSAESYKFVRETSFESQDSYKIEVKFKSEILRPVMEYITEKTGMSKNSKTIVKALLDGAPDIYGYCYVNKSTGSIIHTEVDAAAAVNSVFKNIDGSDVNVTADKCTISGSINNIGTEKAASLPSGAEKAAGVQACG